jgi:hypothetical protein
MIGYKINKNIKIKLNYLQKFMFLFYIAIAVYSCTTDNNKIENEKVNLALNDIETIGLRRNEDLSIVYPYFDFSSENKLEVLKNSFLSISLLQLSYEEKSDAINLVFITQNQRTSNDIETIKASLKTDLAKNMIDSAYENLYNSDFHNDLVFILVHLKTNAFNNLENIDFNLVSSYLEVLEQSSYFWKQADFGSSGEGYSIVLSLQNQGQSSRSVSPFTKAVITADTTGSAVGFLGAGIGDWIAGAINPAALVAGAALAAVASSITVSNTHYACHDGDGNEDDSNNNSD